MRRLIPVTFSSLITRSAGMRLRHLEAAHGDMPKIRAVAEGPPNASKTNSPGVFFFIVQNLQLTVVDVNNLGWRALGTVMV